jgi:hypothetical protein
MHRVFGDQACSRYPYGTASATEPLPLLNRNPY